MSSANLNIARRLDALNKDGRASPTSIVVRQLVTPPAMPPAARPAERRRPHTCVSRSRSSAVLLAVSSLKLVVSARREDVQSGSRARQVLRPMPRDGVFATNDEHVDVATSRPNHRGLSGHSREWPALAVLSDEEEIRHARGQCDAITISQGRAF